MLGTETLKRIFTALKKGNPILFFATLFFLIVAIWLFVFSYHDPKVFLLINHYKAKWIKYHQPVEIHSWAGAKFHRIFRKRFYVARAPNSAFLEVHAFRDAAVVLDKKRLLNYKGTFDEWRQPKIIDISSHTSTGEHEILIFVENENAPPAVLAYCEEISLYTDTSWEVSRDGKKWSPAISVDEKQPIPLSRFYPKTYKAISSKLPYILPLFALVFTLTLMKTREHTLSFLKDFHIKPAHLRFLLIISLAVLGINNLIKLPLHYGFDVPSHLDYIRYIVEKRKLPLATEGFMMYHTPLYYILSSPFYLIFDKLFSPETAERLLRLISIACGIIQVELCFRALRYAFPQKENLQSLGILIGALLPINVYGCQAVGNEAFAGCLISVVMVMCFHLIKTRGNVTRCFLLTLGLFAGLAILAKMTAIIILPAILLLLIYLYPLSKPSIKSHAITIAIPIIVAVIISFWFFARNRILLGSFNIGDWNQNIFLNYWQDPGYRTIKQFYRFGSSLITPVFTAVYGFWDGLYSTLTMDGYLGSADTYELRPPWNYGWLFSGPILGIVPSLSIIIGFFRALFKPKESFANCAFFSAVVLAIYISAMIFHFLQVPFYSSIRATYMIGTITCMGTLAAYGVEPGLQNPWSRGFIYAWLVCWVFAVYTAYFII